MKLDEKGLPTRDPSTSQILIALLAIAIPPFLAGLLLGLLVHRLQ
jgi:hypothetical protein